jgi:ATP-binding cassette subfamily F protein 3
MKALQVWNGGVIIISHDERFITSVAKEVCCVRSCYATDCFSCFLCQLWVCGDGTVYKFKGDVESYKVCATLSVIAPHWTDLCLTETHRQQRKDEALKSVKCKIASSIILHSLHMKAHRQSEPTQL